MNLQVFRQLVTKYPEYFDVKDKKPFVLVGSEGSTYYGQCGKLEWHEISNDGEETFNVDVRDIDMWGRGDTYLGKRLSARVHCQLGWRDLSLNQHPTDGWESRWGDGILPARPSEAIKN